MADSGALVLDASPLIILARIQRLAWLGLGGHQLLVPASVLREVLAGEDAAAESVRSFEPLQWIDDVDVPDAIAKLRLGAGEQAALALALEHPSCEVVTDDQRARRGARELGIATVGTLAIVLRAKVLGGCNEVAPWLEAIREAGLWLDDDLVMQVLEVAGERRAQE